MAESLRDQLKRAGFQETEKPAPRARPKKPGSAGKIKQRPGGSKGNPKRSANSGGQSGGQAAREAAQVAAAEAARVAERKALKARIRTLIESHRLDKWQGEAVYRYALGTRIRQLFVTDDIRKRIIDGELSITRLNGSTEIVPTAVITEILALNPQWAVVTPAADDAPLDDEYADYKVPDDLQW